MKPLSWYNWLRWLVSVHQCDAHPLFERLSDEELESDPAAGLLASATEEGQKVARNSGQVHPKAFGAFVLSFLCAQMNGISAELRVLASEDWGCVMQTWRSIYRRIQMSA